MKKLIIYISLILMFFSAFANSILAEHYDKDHNEDFPEYNVVFNGTELVSNYDGDSISSQLKGMEPGDDATVVFHLKNNYNEGVYWWMSNDTVHTFEDVARKTINGKIEGGNYSYKLVYNNTAGTNKVIYDSAAVGGDGTQGLIDATNALDEYFMLEKIDPNKESTLTLYFELDGETQANNYQEVLGALKVNFAVELPESIEHEPGKRIVEKEEFDEVTGKSKNRRVIYIPYTGDTIELPVFIAIEVILVLLLVAIIVSFVAYKRKQEAR